MAVDAEKRIQELHWLLPEPAKPVAKYKTAIWLGNHALRLGSRPRRGHAQRADNRPRRRRPEPRPGHRRRRAQSAVTILGTVQGRARLAQQGQAARQDARHGQQHRRFQGPSQGHQRLLGTDGRGVRRGCRRRHTHRRRHGLVAGQHSGRDRVHVRGRRIRRRFPNPWHRRPAGASRPHRRDAGATGQGLETTSNASDFGKQLREMTRAGRRGAASPSSWTNRTATAIWNCRC